MGSGVSQSCSQMEPWAALRGSEVSISLKEQVMDSACFRARIQLIHQQLFFHTAVFTLGARERNTASSPSLSFGEGRWTACVRGSGLGPPEGGESEEGEEGHHRECAAVGAHEGCRSHVKTGDRPCRSPPLVA